MSDRRFELKKNVKNRVPKFCLPAELLSNDIRKKRLHADTGALKNYLLARVDAQSVVIAA